MKSDEETGQKENEPPSDQGERQKNGMKPSASQASVQVYMCEESNSLAFE